MTNCFYNFRPVHRKLVTATKKSHPVIQSIIPVTRIYVAETKKYQNFLPSERGAARLETGAFFQLLPRGLE